MSEAIDTADDAKFCEALTEDQRRRYSYAKENGATEVWWLVFKKELVMEAIRLMRELRTSLPFTVEEIAEMEAGEKRVLDAFDARLKALENTR